MFDTSKAYEYFMFGGQVVTTSIPTPDEYGGFITASSAKGWDEPPALNAQGEQNGRTIVLSGAIKAPEGRVRRDQMFDEMVADVPMDEERPLVHYRDGEFWHVMAKLGSASPQKDIIGPRKANYSLQFYARDARRLSGLGDGYENSSSTDPGVPGTMTMWNTGNGYTPPMELRFRNCSNPRVTVDGSPTGALWLALTLPLDTDVRIDMEAHTAVLADGMDVTGYIRGEWPLLDRKQNLFNFTADSYGADSMASIFWLNSKL